jgi:hypothetical protein
MINRVNHKIIDNIRKKILIYPKKNNNYFETNT